MLAEHAAQPRVFKVLVLGTTLALQLVLRRTSSEQAKEKINKFILSFALFLVLLQVKMERLQPYNLSQYLFWDVDTAQYDADKYSAWTVQRVLEYGEMSDWNTILAYYGIKRIVEICKSLRTLTPQALSYICLISNTNKEDYRCYHTAQSSPTLWNS